MGFGIDFGFGFAPVDNVYNPPVTHNSPNLLV